MSVTTKNKFALLGHPLGHSLSPQLHQLISNYCGILSSFQLEEIPPENIKENWERLKNSYTGFSVTIPYKQTIIPYLSGLSDEAQELHAVNAVTKNKGYNTDIIGIRKSLPSLKNQEVLLLGTGGAASVLAHYATEQLCTSLTVCGRTKKNVDTFKEKVMSFLKTKEEKKIKLIFCSEEELVHDYKKEWTIILNGTAAGMWPNIGITPLLDSTLSILFKNKPFVFDAIYNPTATKLLLKAKEAGCKTLCGIEMLFWQAIAGRSIWQPEYNFSLAEKAKEAICQTLSKRVWSHSCQKIILIGFPGSGKTSVSKKLTELLGNDFFHWDIDDLIIKVSGKTIPEIFEQEGELAFRKKEQEILKEVLAKPHSGIIAAGGGALLSEASQKIARDNHAIILYLEASQEKIIERISGKKDRPLLTESKKESQIERISNLYRQRLPLYRAIADVKVKGDASLDEVAQTILELFALG